MSPRIRMEISEWIKVLTIAGGLIVYSVTIRKDVDANAETTKRIEFNQQEQGKKIDALLISNAQVTVLSTRIDEFIRRLEKVEAKE